MVNPDRNHCHAALKHGDDARDNIGALFGSLQDLLVQLSIKVERVETLLQDNYTTAGTDPLNLGVPLVLGQSVAVTHDSAGDNVLSPLAASSANNVIITKHSSDGVLENGGDSTCRRSMIQILNSTQHMREWVDVALGVESDIQEFSLSNNLHDMTTTST
tara:strand:+ start:20 stop:499 length:480 start_codon:yes stop_codon:yes gene_type:complete